MKIQLRFNTEKEKTDSSLPAWRVLIDGVERLAEQVYFETPCWTTQDLIAENKMKWHLTSDGVPHWDATGKVCTIKKN